MSCMKLDDFCKIHDRLDRGEKLMAKHALYGTYYFQMNPQKNRIFITPEDYLSKCQNLGEDQFTSMLLWGCFDVYEIPKKHCCLTCNGSGQIVEEAQMIAGYERR